jgi:hypothetical protein
MQLMPTEDIFELVCKNYFDRNNTREVNYVKFCYDVDHPHDMFPGFNFEPKPEGSPLASTTLAKTASNFFGQSTKGIQVLENRFSQPTVNISNDPNDIESRLRSLVLMKRVRISEFFKDFDKLRKGRVTKTQFKAILSTLSFTLTDEEYNTLIERYGCPDDALMVNYSAFVDSIDSIFTIKGIEKMPTLKVKPIESTDTNLARKKYLEFDDSEKQAMI